MVKNLVDTDGAVIGQFDDGIGTLYDELASERVINYNDTMTLYAPTSEGLFEIWCSLEDKYGNLICSYLESEVKDNGEESDDDRFEVTIKIRRESY